MLHHADALNRIGAKAEAIEAQECQGGDKGRALVAVDKGVRLGDPVGISATRLLWPNWSQQSRPSRSMSLSMSMMTVSAPLLRSASGAAVSEAASLGAHGRHLTKRPWFSDDVKAKRSVTKPDHSYILTAYRRTIQAGSIARKAALSAPRAIEAISRRTRLSSAVRDFSGHERGQAGTRA